MSASAAAAVWSAASGGRGGGGDAGPQTTFPFGKHRGKSYDEVAKSDQGYCSWALKQDNPTGALKDFVEFLQSRGVQPQSGPPGGQPAGLFRPPSSGARPPAAYERETRAFAASQGAGRPAPGGDVVLVFELVQADRFLVRCEKGHGDPGINRTAFVPRHVWGAVSALEGAQMQDDRRSWSFPMASHDQVAASLEELVPVERVPAWVAQAVAKARGATAAGQDSPVSLNELRLPGRLLPYQLEGVKYGVSHGGRCLIGDEMGLGKTVQALSLAAQYFEEWPVLVVCPSSLRWVWKEQIAEWLPDLVRDDEVQVIKKGSDNLSPKAKFWIMSYNQLALDKAGKFQQRPDGTPHEWIIADESHNLKEWNAARTKVIVPMVRKARRAVLLSGTPTRNSAEELHPQLCGLMPNMAVRFQDFRSRYCVMSHHMVPGGKMVSKVAGGRNAAELNYLLTSTVMVRRLKKDVLKQLPPKRRQRVPIEASDAKLMKEVQKEMALLNANESGEGVPTLFAKTARAKLPAVKEYLQEVLERGDEKLIVFAHHAIVMDELSELLAKKLAKDNLTHVRIDGKTPAAKRPELVKRFQEDPQCRAALLSITACGEGLTLTAAGLVIFAELYWVPGAVEQAEARAHRIGTTHSKVVVEFLVVPNSLDDHIYQSLESKKRDTSHVLDGAAESLGAAHTLKQGSPKRPKRPASTLDDEADGGAAPGAPSGIKRFFAAPQASQPASQSSQPASQSSPKSQGSAASMLASLRAASEGATPDSGAAPDSLETPSPPVNRSKIDFLLRAARGADRAQKR